MAVLLPFNASAQLTFQELREVTQLESKDLARHIQQLIDIKLITCNAATGNIVQLSTAAEVNCETYFSRLIVDILATAVACLIQFLFFFTVNKLSDVGKFYHISSFY